MESAVARVDNFNLRSMWSASGTPSTDTQTKVFTISGIPQGAVIQSASVTATFGSPKTGADVLKMNNVEVDTLTTATVALTPISGGNGDYSVTFKFKANGGETSGEGTVTVTDAAVTVVYSYEEPVPEPEPEPEIEHVANQKIAVFGPYTTNFAGNGLVTLTPISCEVSETAGGSYELELVHPMDEMGKWQFLIEDYLIRSPVPEYRTPRVVMPSAVLWKIKDGVVQTKLYQTLPYYTRTKTDVDKARDNPSQYAWVSTKNYLQGEYVVSGSSIYVASRPSKGIQPPTSGYWVFVCDVQSGGGSSGSGEVIYHDGRVSEYLSGGEIVAFVSDYNESYIRVRSLRNVIGYVRRADCETTGDAGLSVEIPPRVITEQLFRIYRVEVDSEENTVTVNARHKSYDYQGNCTLNCSIVEAEPYTAIAIMQGCLVNYDARNIVCDITGHTISRDWSWQNPIYALLDPDEGLVPELRGRLIRDNDDFFILSNSSPRTGVTLSYGVNLLGVTWTRDIDEVITRVIPRGKNKDDNDLFLDQLYVDSEYINDFAVVHTEILDCDCKEGATIENPDGTTKTLTLQDCYDMMLEAGQKRFTDDKADAVAVGLRVQFLLLGDTEEYRQYRGLQNVRLYDAVRIKHGPMGLDSTAQVSYYKWDALKHMFIEIELGELFRYGGRTVTGYNVADSTITYRKLSPGLIQRIRRGD